MLRRLALLFVLVLSVSACGGGQSNTVVSVANAPSVARIKVFSGPTGGVNSVVWSPDGKMIASAGDDHTIYLWDPDTGKEIRHWDGHKLAITSLAFSPDGKTLASGGRDKAVILWDPAGGQQLRTFSDTDQILALAFSPDGKLLASTGRSKTVIFSDPATLQPVSTIKGFGDRVNDLAFSPDGKTLATAANDNKVQTWDVASGAKKLEITDQKAGATAVAFSPTVRCWRAARATPRSASGTRPAAARSPPAPALSARSATSISPRQQNPGFGQRGSCICLVGPRHRCASRAGRTPGRAGRYRPRQRSQHRGLAP